MVKKYKPTAIYVGLPYREISDEEYRQLLKEHGEIVKIAYIEVKDNEKKESEVKNG